MKSLFLAIVSPVLLGLTVSIGHSSPAAKVSVASHPEARFKGGDVAFCKSKPEGLFGFKVTPKGLVLVPAKFENRTTTEEMSALDQYGTEDKPKTCWVLVNSLEFPILVSGLKLEGTPVLLKELMTKISPDETKSVTVQNQKYTLTFPKVSTANYECELGEREVDLDGGGYQILMAADFNNDGLPDFIMQNARKYSFSRYQILMSDKATKKCKAVATHEIYGC